MKVSCNQVVPTSVWNHTWDSESEGGRNTGEKRSRGSDGRTDWCGWEDENEDRDEAEQKPEVLIERYIFVPNRDMNVLWEGRGEARRCCSANTERFNSSSYLLFIWVKWCGPTADTPPCVFDLVSQSERERLLCSGTFCANTSKSSLCLSHGQNQPRSLTRDTRRHETALGRDMNYHTEANLNKMNSWITNISCLLFFPSASCVPWCFKHESWGKWASLQPEKKKSANDNQIAAATAVWLVWYSALITENAEFIIYTFHSFLCSYGLRNIELLELCN